MPLACGGGRTSPRPTGRPTASDHRHDHAPPDPWLTVVATATVPEVEVYKSAAGPTPVDGVTATDAAPAHGGELPAIPRDELTRPGCAKTDDGFAYENPTYFKNPLVFVVTQDDGGEWLKVLLLARPNHSRAGSSART